MARPVPLCRTGLSSLVLDGTTQCRSIRKGVRVLYMIVESFRGGRPQPVYERAWKRGRLAPPGLQYVNSWVTLDGTTCYQVMECEDRALLDQWMAAWSDLVDFSVTPVMTSGDAAAKFTPKGLLS